MNDPWVGRGTALLLGGVIGVQLLREQASLFWSVAVMLAVLVFAAVCFWRPVQFAGLWRRSEIVLLVLSVLVGVVLGWSGSSRLMPAFEISDAVVEGEITAWSIDEETGGRGVLEDTSGRRFLLSVYPQGDGAELPANWEAVRPGSVVSFTAKMEGPQPARSRGAFDLRFYYATQGYTGKMTALSEVRVVKEGPVPLIGSIRSQVRGVVDRFWPETGPVLEAMIFGDASRLPEEALERYKLTGVLHAFAASGMNIGFVVALVWGVTFFLPRRVRIFACLAMVILYVGLCDFSVSVTRAGILAGGVLLGRLGHGKAGALRWLVWSAVLLFVWNPLYLGDVSFWLSFSAVWGIVCLSSRLEAMRFFRAWGGAGAGDVSEGIPVKVLWRRTAGSLGRFLRRTVCLSLAVQLAVTPVLAVTFHRISLVGLLLNVVLAGVLGAAIQLGLVGVCALVLGEMLVLPLFQAAVWLIEAMDKVLEAFARLPWADVWMLQPGWIFWMAWYAGLVLLLVDRQRLLFVLEGMRRRVLWLVKKRVRFPDRFWRPRLAREQAALGKRVLLTGVVTVLVLSLMQMSVRPAGVEIVFLDVGQGDCVLVRSGGLTVMVDAGPRSESYDSAERVVVPYLLEHGIDKIDVLFITHADRDHIGGARYMLTHFPVEKVVVPSLGETLRGEEWQEDLPFDFWPDGQMVMKAAAGDCLTWGGLQAEVLAPAASSGGEASSNDTSLVLRLAYGSWSLLLTGDMEAEEMKWMLDRGAKVDATFVKVPHHGGKGSLDLDFFDSIRPEAVFVSVGKNSYGHPAREVLDYWYWRDVAVYRTDVDGTVRLIWDEDARVFRQGK